MPLRPRAAARGFSPSQTPIMSISSNNQDNCYQEFDLDFNNQYCPCETCGLKRRLYAVRLYSRMECNSQKLVDFLCDGDSTCDSASLGTEFDMDLSEETFTLPVPNYIDIPNYAVGSKDIPMLPTFCETE